MQLSEHEWRISQELVSVLCVLREGTKLVEGEKRPTISVTLPMIYYILKYLEDINVGISCHLPVVMTKLTILVNPEVNDIRTALLTGIVDRWTAHFSNSPERHKHFLLPVLFDPRTKAQPFSYLPPPLQEQTVRLAYEEFSLLCEELSPSLSSSAHPASPSRDRRAGFWARPEHVPVRDEFTRYLEVPDCPVTTSPSAWFESHHEFRHIFKLYCKWCATPAAATSVERLWSQATFLDDRLRSRMSPDFLSVRLFLQKNERVLATLKTEE